MGPFQAWHGAASRRCGTTRVCVKTAGLMMMSAVPSFFAACTLDERDHRSALGCFQFDTCRLSPFLQAWPGFAFGGRSGMAGEFAGFPAKMSRFGRRSKRLLHRRRCGRHTLS
jgi:hypothetical protein